MSVYRTPYRRPRQKRVWLPPIALTHYVLTADQGAFALSGQAATLRNSRFVEDSFTDSDSTNLTSHVGEIGATWTQHPNGTASPVITTNRIRANSGGIGWAYASGVPNSAEYTLEARFRLVSSVAANAGILARLSTSADTYYIIRYDMAAAEWQLRKVITGTGTGLATWAEALSPSDERLVRFTVTDANKRVLIDGVERLTSTDNTITDAGRAGVRFTATDGTSAGIHIDHLNGSDVTLAHYTVTAEHGTFALTGQSTNLLHGSQVTADQGAFALNGQSANLKTGYLVTASQGSFTLTGTAAGLIYDAASAVLTANFGSFSLTGQTANLLSTHTLTAAQGSFSLSGQTSNLLYGHKLTSDQGAFNLSGQTANLLTTHRITASHGTFTETGQSANLLRGLKLTGDHGTFNLTGLSAGLNYSGSNPILTASHGIFSLSGQDATFRKTTIFIAEHGSFALSGQTADLLTAHRLTAEHGAFSETGQVANLLYGRTVVANHGSFTLSGQDATTRVAFALISAYGSFTLSGQDVILTWSAEQVLPPPDERMYEVLPEDRTFIAAQENRFYLVSSENRNADG